MPSLIGSLFVSLTADFAPFQRNMKSAESITASTSNGIRRSMGLTEKSVTSLQRQMSSGVKPYALISAARTFDTVQQRANLLRGALFATTAAFGGLGAALTSNVISRYLDTFQNLQNQIRVVSDGSADLASQIQAVADVADRSRSSLSAVGLLYARLSRAAPGDGSEKLLRRVETINKALQLGGATAQEAASAAIQFSQAIQSNRLGGDELRAVLETPLGGELAKGMGITIGQMRKLSIQGKLTADVVFAALDKISGSVDQKFAKSVQTIDQALTQADNKIVLYAGSINKAYGLTTLIAGAVNLFGNNLDSIVPKVAAVAGGLGIIFAGRTAAGIGNATFGNLVRGIQGVSAARKEDVRVANEQVAATEKAAEAARRAVAAAQSAVKGDVTGLAPKQNVKEYQRDSAALQAADLKHLNLLQEKAVVTTQLGEIYRTTTAGEIKAAQSIAQAEEQVNSALRSRSAIRGLLTKNQNKLDLYPVPTGKTPGFEVLERRKTLLEEQAAIVKRLGAADVQVEAAREAAGVRQTKLLAATNVSFVAAANERAAILINEKRLEQELAASTEKRAALANTARGSKAALLNAGGIAAQAGVSDAASSLYKTESAANRAGTALAIARREAGALSLGLGLVRGAAGSLVGFLGGPWGVAFTAAIAFLSYLGIQAAETAQKIALSKQAIDEAVGQIADLTDQTSSQALVVVQSKIDATKALIDQSVDGLLAARNDIADKINGAIFTAVKGDDLNALGVQFDALMQRFRDGGLTVEQLRTELIALGADPTVLDGVLKAAGDSRIELNRAAEAVAYFQRKLVALNGQEANIKVNVGVNDPLGILTRGLSSLASAKAQSTGTGGFDAAEMSKNAERLKLIQETARRKADREELLRAASDKGQKIEDKAQDLFTDGSGRSLADSRALATKIIQLQDVSKSSKGAKKDYENFVNKLAELKAGSLGAGLGDVDNKVIDFAKNLKNGSKMIKEYIDAVNSGDLSKAPKQLQEAHDAFVQLAAGDQAKNIVQKYGSAVQITKQLADEQEILNAAVLNGSITAAQASLAYADFLGQFQQYEWINATSSAITKFADSAITDFSNIGNAAKSLATDLANILLKASLLDPLQNAITGALGGSLGGGGGGVSMGSIFDLFSPGSLAFHTGSLSVGNIGGAPRSMPAGAFSNAPRYHDGNLKGNELTAILERGEAVLTQKQTKNMAGTVGAMTKGLSGGGAQPYYDQRQFHIDARGAQQGVAEQIAEKLKVFNAALPDRIKQINNDPRAR